MTFQHCPLIRETLDFSKLSSSCCTEDTPESCCLPDTCSSLLFEGCCDAKHKVGLARHIVILGRVGWVSVPFYKFLFCPDAKMTQKSGLTGFAASRRSRKPTARQEASQERVLGWQKAAKDKSNIMLGYGHARDSYGKGNDQ